MRKQQRWFALVMSLLLLLSLMPGAALGATGMINITSDWKGKVFGDVGGVSNITATNFEITENEDGTVKLRSSNDKGKISGSSSTTGSEGIAYYFKDVAADSNFELTAKATVGTWTANSQVSFGIMLRSNVLDNENQSAFTGDYAAVGALDQKMEAFYKLQADKMPTKMEYSTAPLPAAGKVYDISIKKTGNVYRTKVGNETKIIDDFSGSIHYAGLYTARNTSVTFSNVQLKMDSRVPTSLQVDTASMKTNYFVGDSLDLTGLKVKALYGSNEENLTPNDYIVTGFDSSKAGENSIAINFNGKQQIIKLNIIALTVDTLDIKYFPAKTTYYKGDEFDPAGLIVTATYNTGGKADIDSDQYTISIPGATLNGSTYVFDTSGTKTVNVTSKQTPATSTAFDVIVKNADITGLEIKQQPQKTSYFLDETLDLDGLVVYAKYSDNSSVRLLSNEYTVGTLDTSTPGTKQITITHKGKTVSVTVTVKQKQVVGIGVTKYPKTTYVLNESFDKTGLEISKLYDNSDKELLAASGYSVNSSSVDTTKVGTYDVVVTPVDTTLAPIVLKVTVRQPVDYQWKSLRFGQSTSASNKVTVNADNSVKLEAPSGSGKVTGDHDGISYYYTELDATQDNFVLSADITVLEYAKDPYDGQEAFGIMARDAIGPANDSSVFASNIAAIGGYSGGTTKPNGTQLFVRTGVQTKEGTGSKGIQNIMLKNVKPSSSNTPYKLTLSKTNSGFTGKINNEQETIIFEPDILNVQDSKMYVGFFTARLATIEVRNIQLSVSATQSDAPKVEAPKNPVTPDFQVLSLDKTSATDYDLLVKSNVSGTVTVKQGQTIIAQDKTVEAGKNVAIRAALNANSSTNFSLTFLPDDTQELTSYDKIIRNFTVINKSYVPNGDIYVSPTGSANGTGTENSPLDLDTAIAFVKAGQKIVMLDGTYVRSSKLEIKKYNDGTQQAMKYLVAAPGAKPVIDFNKQSEGVVLSGNYWHVKGIDFARSADNTKGFTVGGNYNIVEASRFYENGDTGLQISRTDDSEDKAQWPSYNLILNSESFDNRDPSDNNADGFAAKLTVGEGNIFRGCISHNNIDDGWDLYTKAGSGAIGAVLIEDSIAYNNGTLTNGKVGQGDKNGFKLGGEGIHVPHIIRNSIAFGNGAYGFTSNSNPGVRAENNVSYNNARANLSFTTYTGIPTDFKIDGFVSYQKDYTGSGVKDNYPSNLNSDTNYLFNGSISANKSGVKLTDANFVSLQPVVPYQRNADGSIIWGDFLKFITPTPGTAPAAPAGLLASAGDAQAALTWKTVTDATYYNVYRGASENGTFTKIASNVQTTSYTSTGLTNGTTYYYKVTAGNANGESGYSNVVNVTPQAVVQPPQVPAAPTSLSASSGDAQAALTWKTVTDATYYNVYRGASENGTFAKIASNMQTTSYTSTGLTNGTTYYYKVTAGNANGESGYSNVVKVTPQAVVQPPQVPAAPTSLSASAGDAQAALTWNTVTDATYYNVYRGASENGTFAKVASNMQATSYMSTGLTNGTTYYYKVTAGNANGESGYSNVANVTPQAVVQPPQVPAAPTGLTAEGGYYSVTLKWTQAAGASSYTIYQSTINNGPYTKVASNVTNATYSFNGLVPFADYYYVVTASNAQGESSYSAQASARTYGNSSPSRGGGSSAGSSSTGNGSTSTSQDGTRLTGEAVVTTSDGKKIATWTIAADALTKAFEALKSKNDQKITLEVKSTEAIVKVEIPASVLTTGAQTAPNAVLSIKTDAATYDLPIKVLRITDLAKSLGTTADKVTISLTIERVSGTTAAQITAKMKDSGMTLLSGPIDFVVTAEGNGKSVTVSDFGGTYVTRTIPVTQTAPFAQLTAVMYNPATGELSFVPAIFRTVDGKTEAAVKRSGNSIYAIVKASKTFDDLQGHWAKNEAELLASKGVVNGTSETTFAPNTSITRAEFSALLVRAAGLTTESTTKFSDIKSEWYAGYVGAASKAGLVDGFEDGTFQPNATITREQMATMIARAIKLMGKNSDANANKLAAFADSKDISNWAKDAVAGAVNAGIINGVTDQTFAPGSKATRAEAAVMLKRLLQFADFINE
ncbi:bacterial Ig-like domain-containing protein [Paenibacillus sp. RC67]|uniref:bacterial Ig-like domain-containing protein n=1 Tax=Paenibacillus sp. RC67 TaxID=3039392 RepID=UPI0024AE6DE0|nr:bacterial Ig-like domain-containing protein [Paenibacillus sp. RC67]